MKGDWKKNQRKNDEKENEVKEWKEFKGMID